MKCTDPNQNPGVTMSRSPKDPPLESVVERKDSTKDGPLIIERHRRGLLSDTQVSEATNRRWPKRFEAGGKAALIELASSVRAQLDAADLPTDKWEVMPRELDFGYFPEEHGIIADEDIWREIVEDSTEPLTKHRVGADLLHALNRLFVQFTEEQLSDIHRAMKLYHFHYAIEELHEAALSGMASKKGREKGPAKRKEKAEVLRKLILTVARDFWERNPKFTHQTVNTAKKITDAVNQTILSQELSRKPLALKTIADHLRLALTAAKDD